MLTPTSGNAYVHGTSILTNMAAIRQSLGVCPQFDILWPEISVLEHLALYAAIKGYGRADSHAVATAAACDVGQPSEKPRMINLSLPILVCDDYLLCLMFPVSSLSSVA